MAETNPTSRSLTRAAADGDVATVKSLIAEGTDVNAVTAGGQTALMLAAIFGQTEIVSLLLAAGATVDMRDDRGLTAADWASRRGFPHVSHLIANAPARKSSSKPTDHEQEKSEPKEEAKSQAGKELKMGGAAAAILRTRVARMGHRPPVERELEFPFENVIFSRPKLTEAESETTHAPEVILDTESTEQNLQTQGDAPTQHDPLTLPELESVSSAELTVERIESTEPLVLPTTEPGATLASPAMEFPSTSTPAEEETWPAGKRISPPPSITRAPLPTTEPGKPVASPAGLFNSLSAHAPTGRPLLWLLIAITLGGSVFGALLLNKYLSREPAAPATSINTDPPPNEAPGKPLPVIDGDLAGAELNIPEPEYPKANGNAKSGLVKVRVQVNRKGRVISVRSVDGDWSLRAAAVSAARRATFSPDKLATKGRVVTGTITYSFVSPQTESSLPSSTPASTSSATDASPARVTTNDQVTSDIPVTGGPLAGAEVNLPHPNYPSSARKRGVSGIITITVRVNRAGRVISWRTGTGDAHLRAAALNAARKSTFAPDKLPGKGEVVGTITYNFK